jgi:hypothetical protein
MVAESIRVGNGWRTRPDLVKAARAVDKPEPAQAVSRSAQLLKAKQEAAQKRFQERIAEPVKGHKPELVEIRAGDVQFDRRYQANERYDERRGRKIAEDWDWKKYDPIEINIRPDDPMQTPWCPDGQHRTQGAILRFGPDVMIPALLHRVSYAEEAAMFAHQDENRKRVSDALKFNAGKEAGEAMPLEAQAIADRLGLTLGVQAAHRRIATKTFVELVRMKGPASTEEALRVILFRWDGDTDSLDARIIKGMTHFIDRYKGHQNFSIKKLTHVLEQVSVQKVMQESTRYQIKSNHGRIAAAITGLYNYNRLKNTRLPDWGVN